VEREWGTGRSSINGEHRQAYWRGVDSYNGWTNLLVTLVQALPITELYVPPFLFVADQDFHQYSAITGLTHQRQISSLSAMIFSGGSNQTRYEKERVSEL